MNRLSLSWDSLLTIAMVLIASLCAQSQYQAFAQEAEEGKVVTISPDVDSVDIDIQTETRIVEEAAHWIGIRGRSLESPVLRTHLQLAEGMGVVVEEVVDDSPASRAGLRKHDIILRANGDEVNSMQVLQQHVRGGKDKPLELKIIRLGKQEKLVVVPEVLPETLVEQAPGRVGGLNPLREGVVERDLMQQLMQQFGARNIGPGMVFRGGKAFNFNQMPSGVSVSIQRQNDEPAQITVRQGDQTWQIEGDDEESLKQLPDDVRPFVERMLNGQNNMQGIGAAFELGDLNAQLREVLPDGLGEMRPRIERRFREQRDSHQQEMRKRMEQIEKHLQELQKRLNGDEPELPPEKTS